MLNSWILIEARVALGPQKAERLNIEIRSGKINAIGRATGTRSPARCLNFRDCLILPGLINAHDHLEFNLFPRMGRGPYLNGKAWALDIYHPDRSPIKEHLSISLATRLRWGAVKNLLSGVTTVCEHNPYRSRVFPRGFAIRIPRHYGWAHSLDFCPNLLDRFKQTPQEWPFILHLGEAIDKAGRQEIQKLDALGALDRRTVLVHAVALGTAGLQLARKRGASIVWCPSSNHFILGKTLSGAAHRSGVPIALGTDSALSGAGDLLDELRFANRICRVPASRLYDMVTRNPAQIMKLRCGEGTLAPGGVADLVIVKDRAPTPAANLLKLQTGGIEMVLVKGEVKLASPDRVAQLPAALRHHLHPLEIGSGRRQVYVSADLPSLFRETQSYIGSICLAHKPLRIL